MNSKSTSRLYRTWYAMIRRCHSPKTPQRIAIHYRDRGITVCDEWRNSFEAFEKWARSNGYDDTLTIDRIDSDGNYCPENCQWLTRSENSKKACIERERRKSEGHPKNGEWMVTERFILYRDWKYTVYGYRVLETGLYKSEALKRVKELEGDRPWEHKYHYAPTKEFCVGEIAREKDIACFLS